MAERFNVISHSAWQLRLPRSVFRTAASGAPRDELAGVAPTLKRRFCAEGSARGDEPVLGDQ